MFFLARSALCIGLVAVAASTAGGPTLGAAFDSVPRDAARAAGQACLRSDECLRIGAALLTPSLAPQPLAQIAAPRVGSMPDHARSPAPRRAAAGRDGGAPKG